MYTVWRESSGKPSPRKSLEKGECVIILASDFNAASQIDAAKNGVTFDMAS